MGRIAKHIEHDAVDDVRPPVASSLTPVIRYRDVEAAAEWLASAFGFVIHNTAVGPDGHVRYIELRLGDCDVLICPAHNLTDLDAFMASPSEMRGSNTQICYICVAALDQHLARARSAGATIEIEPQRHADDEGGRNYLCRDPEGHVWSFGTLRFGAAGRQPVQLQRATPSIRAARIVLAAAVTCAALVNAAADYRQLTGSTHMAAVARTQLEETDLRKDLALERRRRVGLEQDIDVLRADVREMKRLATEAETQQHSDQHARAVLERQAEELSTALKEERATSAALRHLIERQRVAALPPQPPSTSPPVSLADAVPPPRLGEVQPDSAIEPKVMPTLAKPEPKPPPPIAKTRFAAQLTMLRDEATIRRLFVELQRRHPGALGGKQPEIRRLVDDHSRTWFKLLAVPPQSKDQAGDICAKLGSEGKALGCSIISY